MNRSPWRFASLLLIVALLLPLLPVNASPGAQADDDVLYLSIVWHQHQPVYYQDPETGVYERPWVRVHAAKDYVDMVTILEQYPEIHAAYNLTPSLIQQLDAIAAGARDRYWVVAEVPAEDLTVAERRYLLERFFDINARIIDRFPRYQELRQSRDELGIDAAIEQWSAQDFRDLQVLFNLAWTDPDFLAQEPLLSLVEQGRDFAEADKAVVFAEHLRLVAEVIPAHRRLQDAGQIEVTTTPFAHPILPLLVDTNLAATAMPDAELPPRFVFGQDAVAHVDLGVQLYEEHFGIPPRGMWPAEGSVAPEVVQMIANAGIQWIATDEAVLARSLPDVEDFTRDSSDTVQQADALYRPYTVTGGRGGEVAILFRDNEISDLVGFRYSGMPGAEAAADFVQRLNNIQARLQEEGAAGPHLVTVLLDGENAWEHYENDGKEFFHTLYQLLSDAENIQTVTPSEYLAMTGEPRVIDELWRGSWIDRSFSTWIGEDEENLAWQYLLQTREALQQAEVRLSASARERAFELMYAAEGSDWFWWYGADQNSGADESFDAQFRGFLRGVYEAIAVTPPDFVYIPIIPQTPQQPDVPFTANFTPTVDGVGEAGEWDNAAYYNLGGEALDGLYYGFDDNNFYLRLDAADAALLAEQTLDFYLNTPDGDTANAYTRFEPGGETPLLGFGAGRLLSVAVVDGAPVATLYTGDGVGNWAEVATFEAVVLGEGTLELAAPLATLTPAAREGNRILLRAVIGQEETVTAIAPAAGPALAALPDSAVPNVVLEVADPTADDHGPGTYEYPRDAVFRLGAYDVTDFIVGSDEEAVIFRLNFRGPVENDWGAPNGLGIHTIDIYIDMDGPENGARLLLPGRNAALPADYAWDYAIWAEGWTPGVFRPGEDGFVELDGQFEVRVNPGQRRVTIRVPRSILPGDPAEWAFAVTIAGQEGYPSPGVWRLRDVQETAEQWRIGGAPAGASNHTRLLDVVYPEPGVQETMLNDYPRVAGDVGDLGPDDFGQVPVITP